MPQASIVALKEGKILKVLNNKASLLTLIGKKTKMINLKKKTLIPGFIDGHSHFSLTANFLNQGFSIVSPPFGNVTTIQQMLQNAKDYIRDNKIPPGRPVYSTGYNDYKLA